MNKRQTEEIKAKDKPSRTDQAREVVQEYADDQREVIKKLRRSSSN